MNKRWIKITVAALVVACFLYAGQGCYSQLHRMAQAHWLGILGIAVVHILTLWIQGLALKYGLDAFENPISEREGFSLSILSSYSNLLLPRSGVGTTAVYLKRVRSTKLIDFSSVMLYNAVLFVFSCASMAAILVIMDWGLSGNPQPWWLMTGLALAIAGSGLAVTFRWRQPRVPGDDRYSLFQKLSLANSRLTSSGNVWRIGLLHFAMVFLRALRLQIAFWALGIQVGFFGVFTASVLGDLAFVIAVTPTALGFREAAITFVAAKIGTTSALALSVAIFDRLVFSLTVVILAQVLIACFLRSDKPLSLQTEPTPRDSREPVTP